MDGSVDESGYGGGREMYGLIIMVPVASGLMGRGTFFKDMT